MANYEATVRTNYFSVKNPTALKELIDSIEAEDTVSLFTHELPDGSMQYGFGCYGSLFGIQDNEGWSTRLLRSAAKAGLRK